MNEPDLEIHMDEHDPKIGPAEAVFGLGLVATATVALVAGSGQRWAGYVVAFGIAALVGWAALARARSRPDRTPP